VSSASSSRTRIANPRALKIGPEALTTFGPDDPSHDATAYAAGDGHSTRRPWTRTQADRTRRGATERPPMMLTVSWKVSV